MARRSARAADANEKPSIRADVHVPGSIDDRGSGDVCTTFGSSDEISISAVDNALRELEIQEAAVPYELRPFPGPAKSDEDTCKPRSLAAHIPRRSRLTIQRSCGSPSKKFHILPIPAAEKRSAVFQPTRRAATAETAAQTTVRGETVISLQRLIVIVSGTYCRCRGRQ